MCCIQSHVHIDVYRSSPHCVRDPCLPDVAVAFPSPKARSSRDTTTTLSMDPNTESTLITILLSPSHSSQSAQPLALTHTPGYPLSHSPLPPHTCSLTYHHPSHSLPATRSLTHHHTHSLTDSPGYPLSHSPSHPLSHRLPRLFAL